MNIVAHNIEEFKIAEIKSDEVVINSIQDGLDVLGNVYYQGFDKVIILKENITSDFFNLKNGIAGEILQKFSNFRIRLAIVGDFSTFTSKSINSFIYESNKGQQITFVRSISEALRY